MAIAANEPLRTGTYAKTLTFTLSTTNPVRVTFTLARWGLAPAREGVNVASSVTFAPRLSRVRPARVTLSVTFDVLSCRERACGPWRARAARSGRVRGA